MKNKVIIYSIIGAIILFGLIIFTIRLSTHEDDWTVDSKGIYVKHGKPLLTPDYVKEQQQMIFCALQLHKEKAQNTELVSQCLGTCGNYSVDIVHVPRNAEDNLVENQCEDYNNGITINFIELDKNGNVVRIV